MPLRPASGGPPVDRVSARPRCARQAKAGCDGGPRSLGRPSGHDPPGPRAARLLRHDRAGRSSRRDPGRQLATSRGVPARTARGPDRLAPGVAAGPSRRRAFVRAVHDLDHAGGRRGYLRLRYLRVDQLSGLLRRGGGSDLGWSALARGGRVHDRSGPSLRGRPDARALPLDVWGPHARQRRCLRGRSLVPVPPRC
jgi:hypothetical protein